MHSLLISMLRRVIFHLFCLKNRQIGVAGFLDKMPYLFLWGGGVFREKIGFFSALKIKNFSDTSG